MPVITSGSATALGSRGTEAIASVSVARLSPVVGELEEEADGSIATAGTLTHADASGVRLLRTTTRRISEGFVVATAVREMKPSTAMVADKKKREVCVGFFFVVVSMLPAPVSVLPGPSAFGWHHRCRAFSCRCP